jgi:antimicrobial peptide system SdpA family protein
MVRNNTSSNTRLLKFVFGGLVITSLVALFFLLITILPSPFYMRTAIKQNVSFLFPQGWAFFTRDAREEKLYAYKRSAKGNLETLSPPGSSYKFYFGLNREGRKIPIEYGQILQQVDSTLWSDAPFDLNNISKLTRQCKAVSVKNYNHKALACGEIIIVKTHVIPRAWSKFRNVKMPSKYVKVYVDCPN